MHIPITLLLMDIHMEIGLKVFRKQNFDRFPEGCKEEAILLHSGEESKFTLQQPPFLIFLMWSSASESTKETTSIQGLQITSKNLIHILIQFTMYFSH